MTIFFEIVVRIASYGPQIDQSHGENRLSHIIITVTYQTLHGLAPAYIKDLLQSYHPARDRRSSKKNLLTVPTLNINSYGRRAFSVSAPRLWNSLPQHIRDTGSLDS